MINSIQDKILVATSNCMRPLARLLLRSGIDYRQFEGIAKEAFLHEASEERDDRGRKPNVSRIAVRTGLSRKEIARLRDSQIATESSGAGPGHTIGHGSNIAARVLQIWHTDMRFLSANGIARDLPMIGEECSFTVLVRLVGGDIPVGAVRAELRASGAIVELESGELRPVKRYFVPGDVGEELVVGLTHIVYPTLEGLSRNTGPLKRDPFVQRFAYSDRIVTSSISRFRQFAADRCGAFVQMIDDWLSSNEAAVDTECEAQSRVGVGVYYFEGAPPGAGERPNASDADS